MKYSNVIDTSTHKRGTIYLHLAGVIRLRKKKEFMLAIEKKIASLSLFR